MFKARLIENTKYYKLLRYQFLVFILLYIPFTVILEYLGISEKWVILMTMFIVIALLGLFHVVFIRPFNQSISRKTLEIEDGHIRIVDFNGFDITEWNVSEVDSIVTCKDYYLPNDGRIPWLERVRQSPHHNFLEIEKDQQKSRFEFHLDSYYMGVQIKKIVDSWIAMGVQVERK